MHLGITAHAIVAAIALIATIASPSTAGAEPGGSAPEYKTVPPHGPAPEQVDAEEIVTALHGDEPGLTEELRARYAGNRPRGKYRVYIERDGSVPSVDVLTSIPGGDAFVVTRLRAARWKPRKKPTLLVVPVVLAVPWPLGEPHASPMAATAPRPQNVAPHALEMQVLDHEYPRLPDAIKIAAAGNTLKGLYKICIGRAGRVTSVATLQSIPDGGDDTVISTLYTWTFKPQAVPICSMTQFMFDIR